MIPLSSIAAGVALLSVVYYIVSSVRAYWRLRHFQGPPLAAWTDLWYIRASIGKKSHLELSDVNIKYGPVARIGPNTLITDDEELSRRINAPRSGYYRHEWYEGFRLGAENPTILSERDGDRHSQIRKRVAPGFTFKGHTTFEADVDNVIFSLIDSWKTRYISRGDQNKPMDMAQQMSFLTMDVITMLAYGEPFGYVTTNSDLHDFIGTMAANLPMMSFIAAVPVLGRILNLPLIRDVVAPSAHDRTGLGKMKGISAKIIARRYAMDASEKLDYAKPDMLASFMAQGLTQQEASDNFLVTLLAGNDTTATSLKMAFTAMLTQPRIINKLRDECDGAQVPLDEIVSQARMLTLPYLQACMKESIRFRPVSTGLLPRVVPPQGDYYKGKFIPGGTTLGQCGWNLQRLNFATYGPDADAFRPERWIEAGEQAQAGDRTRLDRMDRALELVFATGEYKCLGYKLALMELSKVMFELVRRFEIGFIDGTQTFEVNENYGLFLQRGMWVRVEER